MNGFLLDPDPNLTTLKFENVFGVHFLDYTEYKRNARSTPKKCAS
ncbi:hypothetical protein [Occallatibacter savannae]|nr:hypothetical protein [Occallatibacter savannae]